MAMEISRIGSKGQVIIPKSVRKRLNLHEGDKLAFIEENGKFAITKASTLTFNLLANQIAQMVQEKGITEEEMLEELERVREELWNERYNK
jgi:antitoxin PrlF